MAIELVTISEAESRTGLARSTIVRWISNGRMKKRSGSKVALSDLERCVRQQQTGRPCKSGRRVQPIPGRDYRTLAEKNMEPYCGTQGLPRLGRMIKSLTWEVAERGKDIEKLREVLLDALSETQSIEERCRRFIKLYGLKR